MNRTQITLMETRATMLRNTGNVLIYMILSELSQTHPTLQISIEELSAMTNLTYSTVLNHLNELRELGYVDRKLATTLPKTNIFIVRPLGLPFA